MRLLPCPSLLLACFLLSGVAHAGPVPRFDESEEAAVQAERARSSEASRSDPLGRYQSEDETPPAPLPWKALGLLGLVLASVAPFAVRSYRQMAGELGSGSRSR